MKFYTFTRTQVLPISIAESWNFFSNPANLAKITPSDLGLIPFVHNGRIPEPDKMYAGMIITYTIRPFAGTPLSFFTTPWVSEITHAREPYFFVDEQQMGPYRYWHHQHHFRSVSSGTEVEDVVHYALHLYPLSRLVNNLIVRPLIERIFDYRKDALSVLFPNH
jgi:ligand-binding SRPBCC domain-containing protein